MLSLSVGSLLILRLYDNGTAKIALEQSAMGEAPTALLGDAPVVEGIHFAKAPSVALYKMPTATLASLLPRLRAPFEAAIALAAKTVRRRTPFYVAHVPLAVQWVEAEIGRSLPQPDYREVEGEDTRHAPFAQGELIKTADQWTDASLRIAWASYTQYGSEWTDGAESIVARVLSADESKFRAPEIQQLLWHARTFASAGPGDAIDVSAAYKDDEVLNRLASLRGRVWPSGVGACASAVQQEFDAVMGRLGALGLRARPWAKLLRVFAILIPEHLTCLLQHEARAKAVRRLFGRERPGNAIEEQVRIRFRLREALGEETDLHEHTQRVTFCWSLQEQAIPAVPPLPPEDPPTDPPGTSEPLQAPDPPPVQRLTLWPFGRQYAGISAIHRYSLAWRDLLRAAQAGQTADAIVEETRQNGSAGADSAKALRYAVSRLLGLGLLQRDGDLFRPSDEGMRVLEGDNDPLVEQLLVRVYGFAQLLRVVTRRSKVSRSDLFEALRAEYPSWASDFAPSALLAWATDLGLTENTEGRTIALTSYGVEWHARLPETLPKPTEADTPEEEVAEVSVGHTNEPLRLPPFEEIERRLGADPRTQSFVIEPAMLRALHAAWTCNPVKHFVILSGLSGTGKTAVLRHYTHAVCTALALDEKRHSQLVAVSPDWHDPSGLLGYFNPLHEDPTYQVEPALTLVLEAAKNPSKPYFLVLDEMNLARVERYMAPFLSAMETGSDLSLHASSVAVNDVPPRIHWPRNLFLGGTVNMDESTHPFSDKVLDRAFTLEFWNVDLVKFFARRADRHDAAEAVLLALHAALEPARRHFGYRTAGEVIDFVRAMMSAGADEAAALDQAVFAKVLPKLRGEDDPVLRGALEAAQKVAAKHGMTRSEQKLTLMRQRLADTGVTRFWS